MKWRVLAVLTAMVVLAGAQPSAQQPPRLAHAMDIASTPRSLGRLDASIHAMLVNGQLNIGRIQRDSMLAHRVHERLNQLYKGLPVFGGQIVRQMDDQTLVSVFGRIFQGISVPTHATVTAAAAAHAAVTAQGPDAVASGTPVLGVLPERHGGYALAYRIQVRSPWDIQTYYVSATSGAVVQHLSDVSSVTGTPVVGIGTGVLGDREKMSVTQTNGTYEAIDLLRPATDYTLTFDGSISRFNSFFTTGQVSLSDVATDSDDNWTDGAVVDAHAYQGLVYDYYYKVMGRHGLDDANHQIISIVHPLSRADVGQLSPEIVANYVNNAVYLGNGYVLYGDGDGSHYTYLSGALDIVGHELTHGVIDSSSQLIGQDEPGALAEAFADIMGTAIEFYDRPSTADWVIGEGVTLSSPGYIRSLADPSANGYPDNYSQLRDIGTNVDVGGVHVNSTIVSHAFYLAVHGGTDQTSGITVQGVGDGNIQDIAKVFYRAFVFMLGPDSQFTDARQATLQAATDLYGAGSNQYAQVQQAWNAVGVQ